MPSFQNIARQSALYSIVALFGGLAGFLIAASNGITLDGHDHATDHANAHETGHANNPSASEHSSMHNPKMLNADGHVAAHEMPLSLETNSLVPEISITLHKDPMSGYNLHLMTRNFVLSGAGASLAHKSGEGHAHLYIDGVKQARLYGPWIHIPKLDDNASTLSVSLNSNDHRPLFIQGQPIKASLPLAEFR